MGSQNEMNIGVSNRDRQSQDRERVDLGRLVYVLLLFVQGGLSGLSVQTLYHVIIGDSVTSNSNRRFYYIGTNLALIGSLCMVDKPKDFVGPKHIDASCVLVAVYFVALLLTLSSSVIANSGGVEVTRSICGLVGWLVSSFQIYQMVKEKKGLQVAQSR
jgi:hypothetical protein